MTPHWGGFSMGIITFDHSLRIYFIYGLILANEVSKLL